jgi:hypothetical protein
VYQLIGKMDAALLIAICYLLSAICYFFSMTARDIAYCRLINQQIAGGKFTKPPEIVSLLGALQAQDYLGALWAIGLRSPNSTEIEIEQAIADRTIIRTWPMRGTLHFVAPADVRWMLELLTPTVPPANDGNSNWKSMTKYWRAAVPFLSESCRAEDN